MKRIFYYVILILIGGNGMMMAQNGLIHGRVTDMENNPVDGVARCSPDIGFGLCGCGGNGQSG